MNIYLKIFLIAVLCFTLMFGSGMYAFDKYYVDNSEDIVDNDEEVVIIKKDDKDKVISISEDDDSEKKPEKSKLEKLMETSERINVLVFGTDGGRADTIFLMSYDPEYDLADIISIPRDTYHKVTGFDAAGQNKINAIYGFKDKGGSKGMKYFLQKFLGVPIDSYVKVDYSGVASIIDVIGGVEVNIPFKMDYDDEFSEPPLHIHFEPGLKILNGKESVEYLRWRKNNGENGAGDLNRISRQQDFLKKAIDKSIGLRLPVVAKTSLNYIRTDMKASEILNLASKASDFKLSNLKTYRIPGYASQDGNGFYINMPGETEKMFEDIYLRGKEE